VTFSVGTRVYDQAEYDSLVRLRNEKAERDGLGLNSDKFFFPLYRAPREP
jgi:hypothetical protein